VLGPVPLGPVPIKKEWEMPTYRYKVRDKHGRAVAGLMGGSSEKEVVDNLKKMGYTPISVAVERPRKQILKLDFFDRIKDEERALFTRQMYTLLKAGVPLLTGLEAVGEQTTSKKLKDVIGKVKAEVEAGMNFSDALSKYPKIFEPLYTNMVKAGEASGTLDGVMNRLAEMEEYDMDIKFKIKSATRYPLLALGTLIVAFFVIVTFVIPRFAFFFSQFHMELPIPTRLLLGIYRVVHDYWYIVLVALALIVGGFLKFINTNYGRTVWDMFRIRIPIFGPLLFKLYMSRFAKTTSILIASGIDMIHTLDLVADTVGNVIIARSIAQIKEGVNQGKGLAEPMKVSKMFTPIIVQMVAIGEETGKLDELLANASEHYDQQVDYTMKNLTTMIEPILIFALGIMVLFVALGIFLPMWNMVQIAKR